MTAKRKSPIIDTVKKLKDIELFAEELGWVPDASQFLSPFFQIYIDSLKIKFTASKVKILGTKKGNSVIQFTLLVTYGADGASTEWRNCLCGVGKDGPWAMPSQHKYKPTIWNKSFSERVIEGFRERGYLDKLGTPVWSDSQDVTLEWNK